MLFYKVFLAVLTDAHNFMYIKENENFSWKYIRDLFLSLILF